MTRALLFWFYRDVEVCAERLRDLADLHPEQPIYGLYGGPEEDASTFQRSLAPWLADFYVATRQPDPYLKWLQGDLEIVEWFEARGHALAWSSLAVVQWDLLVRAPFDRIVPGLDPAHLYFSGLRRLDPALESRWCWTAHGAHRPSYQRFREQTARRFGRRDPPWCCLFIFAILTRPFLTVYAREARRFAGFLEYKLPTLALLLGFPCLIRDLGVLWDPIEPPAPKPLRAIPPPVPRGYIEAELSRPDGYRLFHPVPDLWGPRAAEP
jgi:hypothetical protein